MDRHLLPQRGTDTVTPQTQPRPKLKHAMTATAFAWIQVKNVWREYFKALGK